MGASIGVAQQHGAEVTAALSKKYEEYKASGLSEEEIQTKITADYEQTVKDLAIRAVAAEVAAESAEKNEKAARRNSKDNIPSTRSSKENVAAAPTRRMSKENIGGPARRLSKDVSAPEVGLGTNKGPRGGGLGTGVSSKGGAKGGGARGHTRRRSFDNQSHAMMKSVPAPPAESTSTNVSPAKAETVPKPGSPVKGASTNPTAATTDTSTTATAEEPKVEEPTVDSWDSVTQQPFCPICHMTFKSVAFYERHVKYSDLHLKAVKKQEEAASGGGEAAATEDGAPPVSPKVKRIEGIHYMLLYTGSKLFWRTQQNIDFDIFHHVSGDAIEIIAHDSLKSTDVNRLYLSYSGVTNIISELQKALPTFGLVSGATEGDDAHDSRSEQEKLRNAISRYVLQRLQMDGATRQIQFNLLASDAHLTSPLMSEPPPGLKPVAVVRRRRTNGEDFEAEMHKLHEDQANLEASVEAAKDVKPADADAKAE